MLGGGLRLEVDFQLMTLEASGTVCRCQDGSIPRTLLRRAYSTSTLPVWIDGEMARPEMLAGGHESRL